MRKSRYTEQQIALALQRAEAGAPNRSAVVRRPSCALATSACRSTRVRGPTN
jgi:hypothetical protein